MKIQISGIISEEDLSTETMQSQWQWQLELRSGFPSPHWPQSPPLTPNLPAPFVTRVVPAGG